MIPQTQNSQVDPWNNVMESSTIASWAREVGVFYCFFIPCVQYYFEIEMHIVSFCSCSCFMAYGGFGWEDHEGNKFSLDEEWVIYIVLSVNLSSVHNTLLEINYG